MNAVTQEQQTALSLPERASVALGSPAHEVKLRELVLASAAILAVTNKAGRDECHTAYMTLKNTRVNINHTVDDVTEDAKAFTKAVKAEATRLLQITMVEEDRLQKLRDEWDEAEQARKDALIAAERARTDGIQRDIQSIRDLPSTLILKSSDRIGEAIDALRATAVTVERFAEFVIDAQTAIDEADDALVQMHGSKKGAEISAAEAEAARIAEAERLAAEKIELARQRAENERIANEQAAERQRLADAAAAQEAAALKLRQQAEANAKAERDAQAKAAAEAQAKLDAQAAAIAEAGRKLAEQQAAADARDAAALEAAKAAEAAAIAKEQDEARREADHGPALMMNAEFDVARDAARAEEAERQRLQDLADQAATDAHQPAQSLEVLIDANADDGVTDAEIINMVAEVFYLTRDEAIDRLQAIDFDAARAA